MDWEKEINELLGSQKVLVNIAVKLSQSNTNPTELSEMLKTVNTLNEICTHLSGKSSLEKKLIDLETSLAATKEETASSLMKANNVKPVEINYSEIINKVQEAIQNNITTKTKEEVNLSTEKLQATIKSSLAEVDKRIVGLEKKESPSSGLEGKFMQIEKSLQNIEKTTQESIKKNFNGVEEKFLFIEKRLKAIEDKRIVEAQEKIAKFEELEAKLLEVENKIPKPLNSK